MNAEDDSTAITDKTTATQPSKEQPRYAEEMLHPRWIAIKRNKDRAVKLFPMIQTLVQEALAERGALWTSLGVSCARSSARSSAKALLEALLEALLKALYGAPKLY